MNSLIFLFQLFLVFVFVKSEYKKDEEVNLDCPLKQPLRWLKGSVDLSKLGTYSINGEKIKFKIDKTTIGKINCTNGTDSHVFPIETAPIMEGETKDSKNAINGETFSYECKGYGFPKPIVSWKSKNETENFSEEKEIILEKEEFNRFNFSSSSDMINNIIKIKNVQDQDGVSMVCFAQNKYGNFKKQVTITVKDKFAALWPFLAICVEVAILCLIIFIYEKRRGKKMSSEQGKAEEKNKLTPVEEGKMNDELRHRK